MALCWRAFLFAMRNLLARGPLFELELRKADGTYVLCSSERGWERVNISHDESALRIHLSRANGLSTETVFEAKQNSLFARFSARAGNTSGLWRIRFPTLAFRPLGNPRHTRLYLPVGPGTVHEAPFTRGVDAYLPYPSAGMTMQWLCLENSGRTLSIEVRDPEPMRKDFVVRTIRRTLLVGTDWAPKQCRRLTMELLFGVLLVLNFNAEKVNVSLHPTEITDEEFFASLDLTRAGLERVREAVERRDFVSAARAWAEYFRNRTEPTAHFRRDTWPKFIRSEFPQLIEPLIEQADRVARGEIAHGAVRLPVNDRQIDWLHNPTRDTNYVGLVGSWWFMNCLGRAYLLTGDEKYARAFAWIFESWYDHQEAMRAFQGGLGFDPLFRAYYPGIRARILADNYYCFASSEALTPQVHLKVMKQLLGCAAWLYAQEQRYRVGNQQVAAVHGLGIVGLMFPEFKDAERWVLLAERRMKEHLLRDFFHDGGHKELCTQYHKTCLRDIAYFALTAERNGRQSLFSDPQAAPALERAYEWLAKLVMPTGETPALHSGVFATDWAVHLLIAARYFHRPDFLWLARRFWDRGEVPTQKAPFAFANYLLCSLVSRDQFARLTPQPVRFGSVHLADSGFAVMRTGWDVNDRYLVFQYGWANTGHAYPGALAFCLAMNGELIATNPGSPRSYRHPAYRYCHSTLSHNVVSIDMASYPTRRGIAPGGKLRTLADLPGAWYVSAYHEGYKPRIGAVIERSILVLKQGPILVRDRVVGGEGHRAQWNFHTPLSVQIGENRTVTLSGHQTYILCPAFPSEITRVRLERHWAAVLPRDCQPTDCGKSVNVLRLEKAIGTQGAHFCVALFERDGAIEALSQRAFRLDTAGREYVVLFTDGAKMVEAVGVRTDAECACVEFINGVARRVWIFNGTNVSVNDTPWFRAETRQSVELLHPQAR